MAKVSDIMIKNVITVTPDTSISIALKVLLISKITGIPVVDGQKNLVGIISEKDFMGLLFNKEDIKDKTVADYMTSEVKGFSPDESVEHVCEILLNNVFRRVPIIDEGKLVGIVSRRDIISHIFKEQC